MDKLDNYNHYKPKKTDMGNKCANQYQRCRCTGWARFRYMKTKNGKKINTEWRYANGRIQCKKNRFGVKKARKVIGCYCHDRIDFRTDFRNIKNRLHMEI